MCVFVIKMHDGLFPVTKLYCNLYFTNMAGTDSFPAFVFAVSLPFFMLCHSASSCHYTTPQIFRGAASLWNFPPSDVTPQREEAAAARALCWKPTCCLLGLAECPQNTNTAKFKVLFTTKPELCSQETVYLCHWVCMKGEEEHCRLKL